MIWIFYATFLGLLVITFAPVVGAECNERFVYPACFMLYFYTMLAFFAFITKLYLNDYYMDPLKVSDIDNIEEVQALNESEREEPNQQKHFSQSEILKQMFTVFHKCSCVKLFFKFTMLTAAHLLNNTQIVNFLECRGPDNW